MKLSIHPGNCITSLPFSLNHATALDLFTLLQIRQGTRASLGKAGLSFELFFHFPLELTQVKCQQKAMWGAGDLGDAYRKPM